MFLDFDAIV